jgi:tetratricopeptide (TPR) repeat protein
MLGHSYYQQKNYKKALPHFASVYKQNQKNPSAAYNYAQSLLHLKQYDKALPLFTKCLGVAQLPHTPLHIAKCKHHLGKVLEAKRELSHFIKSTKAPALKQMGVLLMKEFKSA